MILWIQHEDHNAEDHEQSDDDNIQRNHDPKNGDTCYPGLGAWHSCFFGISFWQLLRGGRRWTLSLTSWSLARRPSANENGDTGDQDDPGDQDDQDDNDYKKVDLYLVSLNDNGLSFPSHAAVNFIRHSHAHLVRPARQMERWKRPNDKRPNGERIREKVSPSDSGEHRGEFTDSILSDGGVEADHKVVLVQHVQHNLVAMSILFNKTFTLCCCFLPFSCLWRHTEYN